MIDAPIARQTPDSFTRVVRSDGQSAISRYKTLDTCSLPGGHSASLVELSPITGRTHQLRVHMAAIGHPLLGDWLYGTEDRERIPRPALHAAVLRLRHPTRGTLLSLEAELPADMARYV
jgi:23S rRNA-/tRNA-specific pseudouridylate synthase